MSAAPAASIDPAIGLTAGEVRVNTTVGGSQSFVSMTALPDGGYVVTWTSASGSASNIYAQRFDSTGNPVGGEVRVNTTTGNAVGHSTVAAISGGGYVVAWESYVGVYAQRYDASGSPVGGEILVDPSTTNEELSPSVAGLAGGGFVVTWHSSLVDGSSTAILAQRFDAAGTAQGGQVRVNSFAAGTQHHPSITALPGGGYVITWMSLHQDGDAYGVYAQRYDGNGVAQGGEFRVATAMANHQEAPAVTALADGGFVVVWISTQEHWAGDWNVYGQRFDASGMPEGGEFRINDVSPSSRFAPDVAGLPDGGFLVSWRGNGILVRRFDSAGDPVDVGTPVNISTSVDSNAVIVLEGGDVVAGWAWHNYGGTSPYGAYTRRLSGIAEDMAFDLKGRMSVSDAGGGSEAVTVTLAVTHGVLNVVAGGSGAIVADSGTATVTITGTIDQINALLSTDDTSAVSYVATGDTPPSSATLTLAVVDGDGLSGTAAHTVQIVAVNDAPAVTGDTSIELAAIGEDAPWPRAVARSVADIFGASFSESDSGFAGIAVVANGSSAAVGRWQYFDGVNWVSIGTTVSESAAWILRSTTYIRFNPAPNYHGAAPELTVRLIDDSRTLFAGEPISVSREGAGGSSRFSAGTLTLGQDVTPVSDGPVLDLNAFFSGVNNSASYTENGAPAVLAPVALLTEADGDVISAATLTIGGSFQSGADRLTINGASNGTIGTITFSYDAAAGVMTLTGAASPPDYQAALRLVAFSSTSDNPGSTPRTVAFAVTDEDGIVSTAVTTTVNIVAVNDAPAGGNDSAVTDEASVRVISVLANDSDPDGPALSVTQINGQAVAAGGSMILPSGARVTLNPDGTLSYDPNGAFNSLAGAGSGASNLSASDSFTYRLAGAAGTTGVAVTVNGLASAADVLIGSGGADHLRGTGGSDRLQGGAGGDTLDGGGGADVMEGGTGNDIYVVDSSDDQAIEAAESGTDRVIASVSYTLGANVEHLQLTGSENISGTGNGLVNFLIGNDGENMLDGGAGADAMQGGLGNDTYVIDSASDQIIEAADGGFDMVISSITYTLRAHLEHLRLTGTANISGAGNALGNILFGNDGNNTLDGGGAADAMQGGLGHDTYVVDDQGDQVIEDADSGLDRVMSSIGYTLGANVEHLVLTGSADISATGNALINFLQGNDGDNVLDGGVGADAMRGGRGDDSYVIDHWGDQIIELAGGGEDRVVSSVSHSLRANVEQLELTGTESIAGAGNALDNLLVGNDGNNTLDGAAGADAMEGGLGNDSYVVDSDGDRVTELDGGGQDRVLSSISYALGENVEHLILTGSADIYGIGHAVDNFLVGNDGANLLDGAAGADGMQGGLGNDTYVVDNAGDRVIEAWDPLESTCRHASLSIL